MQRQSTTQVGSRAHPLGTTTPTDAATVRIDLLGRFRVTVVDGDGRLVEPTTWRLAKAKTLIKLLALAPQSRVERTRIEAQLWPELTPDAAANNVHQVLLAARRALAVAAERAQLLRLEGGVITLAPADKISIDVQRFEAAATAAIGTSDPELFQAAIDGYGGDLLPDDGAEPWLIGRRESLRRSYLALLLRLALLQRDRREVDQAIATLRRAIAADPALEEAHIALMVLYAATGRRQQAVGQFRQLQAALARELDVEPAPQSRAIYDAIWSGQPIPTGSPPTGADQSLPATARSLWAPPPPHDSTSSPPTNLPVSVTHFIGREHALQELDRQMAHSRLVTVTGGGGSGKTRLALEWATERLRDEPDGVWLVELAPVVHGALAPSAIAHALRVPLHSGQSPRQTLIDALRDRQLVLVLDNCEHIGPECATMAQALLDACPRLRLLATSRQPLGLPGEVTWPIPPFAIPSDELTPDLEAITRLESVRLFIERAQRANPQFAVTDQTIAAVSTICHQFGELPLAIELIAARTRTLSVAELARTLDRGLDLLALESSMPSRHQSIRSTLDWSYDLLSRAERALFRRLAVFRGSCPLEAVEEICLGGAVTRRNVLGLFMRLVDKSLVLLEEPHGEARHRLLEPVRQYARQRAAAAGELDWLHRRHAEFYAALAHRAEAALEGPKQPVWLAHLAREHGNLRAAIAWCVETTDATELGLQITADLWRFWQVHNHHAEARQALSTLLARRSLATPGAVANALNAAGNLARDQSDLACAKLSFEESLALQRELGNGLGVAHALNNLGLVARETGELDKAHALAEESLFHYRAVASRFGEGLALLNLGQVARWRGDLDAAVAWYEASLREFRALDDRWHVASLLVLLARAVYEQEDTAAAHACATESLTLHRDTGDVWGTGVALSILGKVAMHRGDLAQADGLLSDALQALRAANARRTIPGVLVDVARLLITAGAFAEAARLLGAAMALRDAVGAHRPLAERVSADETAATVRAAIDDDTWTDAWTAGVAMPESSAIDRAIAVLAADLASATFGPPIAPATRLPRLTPREQEMTALVARGLTNRAIAQDLMITERTVETHIRRVLGKLGGSTRADITAWVAGQVEGPQPTATGR